MFGDALNVPKGSEAAQAAPASFYARQRYLWVTYRGLRTVLNANLEGHILMVGVDSFSEFPSSFHLHNRDDV
jgi:hypothetical protein